MNEPTGALLDPATLTGMGIQQQPFQPPAEDSLFVDESLELQVQMLRHNLRYSNMLQVLCGRPGAGKTTLTISLVRVVNQELELFLVRGERGLTASRIFADLLRALECETTADSATDVATFTRALAAAGSTDTPAALVVDDAHLLERRELEQLLANTVEIDQGTTNGFRLLLVGQVSLRDKLESIESPLLLPGRVYFADIKPLSVEQTSAYLAHRLSGVGATWPFDDEEVASIAATAGGLPSGIDSAAATTLNHKYAVAQVTLPEPRARTARTANRPGLIRALGVGAIVVVTIAWTLWPEQGPEPEPSTRSLPLPEPPPIAPLQPVFKDEAAAPEPASPAAPAPGTSVAGIEPPADPADEPSPAPANESSASPAEEPLPALAPADAGSSAQPAAVARSEAVEKPPPAPVAQPTNPAPAEPPRGSAWLQKQRKDHYLVQLMAARDREVLEQFIRENGLGSQAAVFSTRREGLPWHVLLYGLYANADVARAAIPQLPTALRKHSPWIRSVASVQKALREKSP